MTTTVKTQTELDAALKGDGNDIAIASDRGVWLEISNNNGKDVTAFDSASVTAYDSASVRASGSASVTASGSASVTAYGSASVTASDSASVTAYDSASVTASGSASVTAYDSASVTASGSASVRASGSASVRASGSASVRASGSASVRASDYVAVHLHSARVKHEGGIVIDVTKIALDTFTGWAEYHGVDIIDGQAIVYKAVNDDLESGRGFAYPIGETVECPDWKPGDFCGNGLHLSPHPHQAADYYPGATRFLKCSVPIAESTVIDPRSTFNTPKLKTKTVTILAEVDIHGREVTR